jgi:hypothetical protein
MVPQDGQQRAERRGGQRQPDRHVVPDVPGRAQSRRHPHGEYRRDQPAQDRQRARTLPQQPRIQFVAGQQEQEAEPDIGQQLDAGRLGHAEHVRADQDAAEQQDDNLRNTRARQHGNDERRERGHQRHGHQVRQPLVQIHDGRLTELARIGSILIHRLFSSCTPAVSDPRKTPPDHRQADCHDDLRITSTTTGGSRPAEPVTPDYCAS